MNSRRLSYYSRPEDNLYELQKERYKIFKTQNPAYDYFDVVFEIDEKKLYANKFTISSVSPTFKAMVSNRWSNDNDPIPIKDYSFENFKEFITFIYSGTCELTNDNVFTMVDMAEFYGVPVFKDFCETFSTKIVINSKNVDQMTELANKYSLMELKENVNYFIFNNTTTFIWGDGFSSSSSNLYKLQKERFEVFKAQDRESEDMDVVFEINRKILYANKFTICSISSTLQTLLSNPSIKEYEPIAIQSYSYENFKEFISFVYSGECKLTDDNIIAMIDIAEFYGVKVFKKFCEMYFYSTLLNVNNVCQMAEIAIKYSFDKLKIKVFKYVSTKLLIFIGSEKFPDLSKVFVKDFLNFSFQNGKSQETLFEAVYKWAETRATDKQNNDTPVDLKELIKDELVDFIHLFQFEKMNPKFFMHFITNKPFLFPKDKLNCSLRQRYIVKVTDENGNTLKGELFCGEKVLAIIRALKNYRSSLVKNNDYFFWDTNQKKPSVPSKLKKNELIQWYLAYDWYGGLCVKPCGKLAAADYLLAELYADRDFRPSEKCTIDVFSFP